MDGAVRNFQSIHICMCTVAISGTGQDIEQTGDSGDSDVIYTDAIVFKSAGTKCPREREGKY